MDTHTPYCTWSHQHPDGTSLVDRKSVSPAPQHSRAPSPSIPALTSMLLDRAGRGMLRRAGGSTEQASQARTCLGPEVEEKLPSFPAPLLELGLQGASPRFLLVSQAPPKEQLPEHVGQRLGPAGVRGTERPPRCCLPSLGCSRTPWALAGSSWTSSPVPGHGPQSPERPVSRVWLLPSPHQHTSALNCGGKSEQSSSTLCPVAQPGERIPGSCWAGEGGLTTATTPSEGLSSPRPHQKPPFPNWPLGKVNN